MFLISKPYFAFVTMVCATITVQTRSAASPATDAVEQGRNLQEEWKYEESFRLFEKAIQLDPTLASAYLERGKLFRMSGNRDKALKDLYKAIALAPKSAQPYYYLGLDSENQGNYAAAIKNYNKAIHLHCDDFSVYYYRGNAWRHTGEYRKALEDYTAFIALEPDVAFINFSISHDSNTPASELAKDTIIQCTLAIAEQDDLAAAHFSRACTYEESDKNSDAILDFSAAIQRDPKLVAGYYLRAHLAEPNQAISDCNTLIELDKKNEPTYLALRADQFRKLKQVEKADQDYSRAIALQPSKADRYFERAHFYKQQGRLEDALSDFSRILYLNPDYISAYAGRGEVYQKLGEFQKSVDDFTMALNDHTAVKFQLAEIHRNRALAFRGLSEFEKAIADCDAAIEADPTVSDNYWVRGEVYRSLGEYDKSCSDLYTALSMHPNFDSAVLILRCLLAVALCLVMFLIIRAAWIAKAFVHVVAVGMLVVALGTSPEHDYFTLLRFLVCPVSAFSAYQFWKLQRAAWAWVYGVGAVLFNPILPIHLERGTWQWIDLIAAIFITVSIFVLRNAKMRLKMKARPAGDEQTAEDSES